MVLATLGGFAVAQTLTADTPIVSLPTVNESAASENQLLVSALAAGRAGEGYRVRTAMNALGDPIARKLALWAMVDGAPQGMSFAEADLARRDLQGWPHLVKRDMTAESLLEQSGMSPRAMIDWFAGAEPRTRILDSLGPDRVVVDLSDERMGSRPGGYPSGSKGIDGSGAGLIGN